MQIRIIVTSIIMTFFAIALMGCSTLPETNTLNFNSNGGSLVDSITTDGVSTISLPNVPIKDGYIFDGWYWDNDVWEVELLMGHSLVDAPTNNNLTVYAKWIEDDSFTIIFNSNGGTSVESVNVDGVSTISLPNDPTKTGFILNHKLAICTYLSSSCDSRQSQKWHFYIFSLSNEVGGGILLIRSAPSSTPTHTPCFIAHGRQYI